MRSKPPPPPRRKITTFRTIQRILFVLRQGKVLFCLVALLMGASHSALHKDHLSSPSPSCLGDLPEDCVALIVENLDPVEICRLSKLNRAFRGASWADFVWESKLPANYEAFLERILGCFPENLQKRDIYAFLCRVNSFDQNTKVRLSSLYFLCFAEKVFKTKCV